MAHVPLIKSSHQIVISAGRCYCFTHLLASWSGCGLVFALAWYIFCSGSMWCCLDFGQFLLESEVMEHPLGCTNWNLAIYIYICVCYVTIPFWPLEKLWITHKHGQWEAGEYKRYWHVGGWLWPYKLIRSAKKLAHYYYTWGVPPSLAVSVVSLM